jgi:NADH-quinone oxidoreductase subunit N
MAAFAVIIWLENALNSSEIEDYEGLAQRSPLAAVTLTIAFLSLIGIPPLAGFFGKFFLFGAALKAGLAWLAVVGVLNSVVSAFYYLEVVRRMFFFEAKRPEPLTTTGLVSSAAVIGIAGAFLLGIFVNPAFQWAQSSLSAIVTLTVSAKAALLP